MPSSKKEEDLEYVENGEEEELYSVDLDEDNNPYINNEIHNLGMEMDQKQWLDLSYSDIVHLYEYLIHYRNNVAESTILEKITFNRFLLFVSRNSFKSP